MKHIDFDKILKNSVYKKVKHGDDRHITYSKNSIDKILVDVGGNEWHHELNGVVTKVGNLDNKSLLKFLNIPS